MKNGNPYARARARFQRGTKTNYFIPGWVRVACVYNNNIVHLTPPRYMILSGEACARCVGGNGGTRLRSWRRAGKAVRDGTIYLEHQTLEVFDSH